jgi:hypothetical protein
MLEVSRDTVAAEEELLVSCAAEKNKYYYVITIATSLLRRCNFGELGSLAMSSGRR